MSLRFMLLLLFPLCILVPRDKKFDQLYLKVNLQRIPIASSFLVEKGKKKTAYAAERIYDDNLESAWCVSKNSGIGEYIYIPYTEFDPYPSKYNKLGDKELPIVFEVSNGFSKTKDLYDANNRPKMIRIELQEVASDSGTGSFTLANDIYLDGEPVLNSIHDIILQDSPVQQKFQISLKPKILDKEYFTMSILAKLTILEVYPGTKWKDTCITEARLYFDIEEFKKRKK